MGGGAILVETRVENDHCELGVLIPFKGRQDEIEKTLKSLNYNHDFLVVLIDDGSTPALDKLYLKSIVPQNVCLKVIRFSENKGIVSALNEGLSYLLLQGVEFVARIDGGDINKRDRFLKQIDFMNCHPEVVIVGGWAELVNGVHRYRLKPPSKDAEIRNYMLQNTAFIHPCVMYRADVILMNKLNYSNFYPYAEDYEFFGQLIKYGRAHNLPEIVLVKHEDQGSISIERRRLQLISRIRIQLANFSFWNIRSWMGVSRALALLLIPMKIVQYYRRGFWK